MPQLTVASDQDEMHSQATAYGSASQFQKAQSFVLDCSLLKSELGTAGGGGGGKAEVPRKGESWLGTGHWNTYPINEDYSVWRTGV